MDLRFKNLICPDCGSKLRATSAYTGRPVSIVMRYCDICDTRISIAVSKYDFEMSTRKI